MHKLRNAIFRVVWPPLLPMSRFVTMVSPPPLLCYVTQVDSPPPNYINFFLCIEGLKPSNKKNSFFNRQTHCQIDNSLVIQSQKLLWGYIIIRRLDFTICWYTNKFIRPITQTEFQCARSFSGRIGIIRTAYDQHSQK